MSRIKRNYVSNYWFSNNSLKVQHLVLRDSSYKFKEKFKQNNIINSCNNMKIKQFKRDESRKNFVVSMSEILVLLEQ